MAIDLTSLGISQVNQLNDGQVLSLDKNSTQVINLEKVDNIERIHLGLSWDGEGDPDLNIMLGSGDLMSRAYHSMYTYANANNNLPIPAGIEKSADATDGFADGEDEWANIELSALAPDVTIIGIFVTIYSKDHPGLSNFGSIRNVNLSIENADSGRKLANMDLSMVNALDSCVYAGELVKDINGWSFAPNGEGSTMDIIDVANQKFNGNFRRS